MFYADLHIHSKYSRATSRNCDLENLAWWARRKGIAVVGTGDFTHPAWFEEICTKLVPAESGLFRLRPDIEREVDRRLPPSCRGVTRFLLEVEISTIYKKGEKTRKVHHLIYAPDLKTAGNFRDALGRLGNINSDGRPILGLDSRHLLEITLESGPGAYLIPAHIWTPWFAVLGSKSGFDSVEECYGDLSEHIFAVETGLSSDPPMNWRVSDLDRFTLVSNSDAHSPPMLGREACVFDTELDYFAMRRALETRQGYGGTVEFFPEEGKYHLDGHRACGVCLEPDETRRHQGLCPECGKPVTVGVMHRVEVLADRQAGQPSPTASEFRSLVPLPEIMSEIHQVGPKSKTVELKVAELVGSLGPELQILNHLPLEEVRHPLIHEALTRLRQGRVQRNSGYDGEFGKIQLFESREISDRLMTAPLFDFEPVGDNKEHIKPEPKPPKKKPQAKSELTASLQQHGDDQHGGDSAPGTELTPSEHSELPPMLRDLDADQRRAAEALHGPLLIVAGPGTGKTRTLTHRLAHLLQQGHAKPEKCLALTFTHRAADEMAERLEALVPEYSPHITVTTFHGLGLQILEEQAAKTQLQDGFRVADEAERIQLVEEIFNLSHRWATRLLADLSQEKRRRVLMNKTEGHKREDLSPQKQAELATSLLAYEEALEQRQLLDFDDLLLRSVSLLEQNADLLVHYQQRFRWISIDEYQDIDALQYRLIRLLTAKDGNLCAIGDPDQSIYRFRGANVAFFLKFHEDYGHEDCSNKDRGAAKTVQLSRNYRSGKHIVSAALQAIAPSTLVQDRRIEAMSTTQASRPVLHRAPTERAEAEFVVHNIERLLGGTSHFSLNSGRVDQGAETESLSFNDFAILYRTDAQSALLVEALERSGIPYQKRSHNRLADRPGMRPLLAKLRERWQGSETEIPLGQRLKLAQQELLQDLLEEKHGPVLGARHLLTPLLAQYEYAPLEDFFTAITLGAEVDTWDPRAERVSLLTLHASKGLEFPVVFLVGCIDGLIPLRWSTEAAEDAENIAEERRLFFVGITRARQRLFLSSSEKRYCRGEVKETQPSPFLANIQPTLFDRQQSQHKSKRSDSGETAGPQQLTLL